MSNDGGDDGKNVYPLFGDKTRQRANPFPYSAETSRKEVLEWINKFYATVLVGGKQVILHEEYDTHEVILMPIKDFTARLMNIQIPSKNEKGDITLRPSAPEWLKWSERREYRKIIFDPKIEFDRKSKEYNLWKGWKIIPAKGNVTRFMKYMLGVICNGNKRDFKFLVALISQMFQNPGSKPGIAVVIQGEEGTGKSFFVETLREMASGYEFKTSKSDYVFGKFNSQLKNVIILHLEEAYWAGNKRDESLLKDLITGNSIEIEPKGIGAYSVDNHLHLFITGNPEWLVSASFKARRILALHANENHRVDIPYFKSMKEWLYEDGGLSALMHYFMNYDYSWCELRLVPITDELIKQKKLSLSGVDEWWCSILMNGETVVGELQVNGELYVIKKLLYDDYCMSSSGRRAPLSPIKFGFKFGELFPKIVDGKVAKKANKRQNDDILKDIKVSSPNSVGKRVDAYVLPELKVARQLMSFKLTGSFDKSEWIDADGWTVTSIDPHDVMHK